jgi:hypothetical protein
MKNPSWNLVAQRSSYRVLYKTDLDATTWSLLTTVSGDGTTKSVSDSMNQTRRFYRVSSP